MGLFLGNLHILTQNAGGHALAMDAFCTVFAELGYEQTADAKLSAVSVTIVTSPDFKWTSAISEEWTVNPSLLAEAGARLSQQAKASVLTMVIHDSDSIQMTLYEKGLQSDRFTNDLDDNSASGYSRGDPQKWRNLLENDAQQNELRKIWDASHIFVEEKLDPLAKLLKIPKDQLRALPDELEELGASQQLTLHFQKKSKASDVPLTQISLDTEASSFPQSDQTTVNDLLWKQCIFVNRGLPFTGFAIVVNGPAVRDGIISLERAIAKYYTSNNKSALRIGHEQYSPQVEIRPDRSEIICKFNELKVTTPGDPEDRFRLAIQMWLKGDMEGFGKFDVQMVPNPDASAKVGFEYPITVGAPNRKPLKFTGNPFDSSYLRQMSLQKYMLGVAVAEDKREIWPDLQLAFEQLLLLTKDPKGTVTLTTQKNNEPGGRLPTLTKKKLDIAGFVQSKQWQTACKDSLKHQLILAEVEEQFGIIYQIPWISPTSKDRACVHIGIWTLMPSPEQMDQYEHIIALAIRQAMLKHSLQGFMAAWDWKPSANRWRYTPYEHACFGSNPAARKDVESADWCKGYLRAVGTKIWLGAELLDHVGGIASLKKLSGFSYCAPYAEITLTDDAEFNQTEAVLEPILASLAELTKS
jgi:hypothetical protein